MLARILFILLVLLGAALGIAYPWAAGNLSGYEIGSWRVYDRAGGFVTAEANLAPSDAPVTIELEVATSAPVDPDAGAPLTLTVDSQDKTVLAQALDFRGVEPSVTNPQSGARTYRVRAGRISEVESGRYVFAIGPGDAPSEAIETVSLSLEAGAFDLDPRTTPAGYVLMAIGLVGLIASFGRRKRPQNPNSSPPPSRWGRGRE